MAVKKAATKKTAAPAARTKLKGEVEVPKLSTLTSAKLVQEALDAMEDDLRIAPKQARDFIASIEAVIGLHLEQGEKVNILGLVALTPSYRPALPRRKGRDFSTGEETMLDPRPASTRVTATVSKRVKDTLPSPKSKAGQYLKSIVDARKNNSEVRKAHAEKNGG